MKNLLMRFIISHFISFLIFVSFAQAQNSYRGVSLGFALKNGSLYENSSSLVHARLYYSSTPTDSSDIFAQVGFDFPTSLLLSAGLNIDLSQYLNLQTYFGLGGIRVFTKEADVGRIFFNTFLGIALESNVYGPIILGVAIEQRMYIPYGILSFTPGLLLNTRVRL